MADRAPPADPAITVFICGGPGKSAPCSRPGCVRRAEAACSYPVTRKGAPATCGAHLCDRCARPGADGTGVICGPHADLLARKAATP